MIPSQAPKLPRVWLQTAEVPHPSYRQAAVMHLAGGFPTRIHLTHSDGGNDKCTTCGERDTMAHRVKVCSKYSHVRGQFPALVTLSDAQATLPWLPRIAEACAFRAACRARPPLSFVRSTETDLVCVYTDGSAIYPKVPQVTVLKEGVMDAVWVIGPVRLGYLQTFTRQKLRRKGKNVRRQGRLWLDRQSIGTNFHGGLNALQNLNPDESRTFHTSAQVSPLQGCMHTN